MLGSYTVGALYIPALREAEEAHKNAIGYEDIRAAEEAALEKLEAYWEATFSASPVSPDRMHYRVLAEEQPLMRPLKLMAALQWLRRIGGPIDSIQGGEPGMRRIVVFTQLGEFRTKFTLLPVTPEAMEDWAMIEDVG